MQEKIKLVTVIELNQLKRKRMELLHHSELYKNLDLELGIDIYVTVPQERDNYVDVILTYNDNYSIVVGYLPVCDEFIEDYHIPRLKKIANAYRLENLQSTLEYKINSNQYVNLLDIDLAKTFLDIEFAKKLYQYRLKVLEQKEKARREEEEKEQEEKLLEQQRQLEQEEKEKQEYYARYPYFAKYLTSKNAIQGGRIKKHLHRYNFNTPVGILIFYDFVEKYINTCTLKHENEIVRSWYDRHKCEKMEKVEKVYRVYPTAVKSSYQLSKTQYDYIAWRLEQE